MKTQPHRWVCYCTLTMNIVRKKKKKLLRINIAKLIYISLKSQMQRQIIEIKAKSYTANRYIHDSPFPGLVQVL